MLWFLLALVLLPLLGTLGSSTPTDQVVLLSPPHANMSNADSRVSLGDCDLWLTTSVQGHPYRDQSQSLLYEIGNGDAGCNLHSAGCWGFFVVRTCFAEGDDQQVAQAMAKLDGLFAINVEMNRAALYPSEPAYLAADAELMRRFHNVLIDDLQLRDASVDDVKGYMIHWLEAITEPREGPRYNTVILLDSEVVYNLNRLPDKFVEEEWNYLQRNKSNEWIKFVDVVEGEGANIRAWAWDLLSLYSILTYKDFGVCEVGMEEASDGGWNFYSGI